MFKLVDITKWENEKAIVLAYADTKEELGPVLVNNGKSLTLSKGSMAYLSNGNVYVLGDTWNKVGGGS